MAAFRKEMRRRGALQYSTKVGNSFAEGPCVFLVREMIFLPEQLRNHDYLGVPEIVEDICVSFEEAPGRPLRDRFVEHTLPCIVKFWATEPRADALGAALVNAIEVVSRVRQEPASGTAGAKGVLRPPMR